MTQHLFAPQYRLATVDAITTLTCAGWDGALELIPREHIAAHLAAHHGERVGAYLLGGDDRNEPFVYAGSGYLAGRLTRHLADVRKGCFNYAIICYAPSGWLTNARAAHVEARLYRTICSVGQVRVLNQLSPSEPRLDGPGDVAALAFWCGIALEGIKLLGAGLLVERLPAVYAPLRPSCACGEREDVFRLASSYEAFLVVRGDALHIRAGSLGRSQEGERWAAERGTGWARRRELLDAGVLRPLSDGEHVVAMQDIPVTSPSQASCILTCQETSGQTGFRHVSTAQTFAEFYAHRQRPAA
jgi:hypothetical protein